MKRGLAAFAAICLLPLLAASPAEATGGTGTISAPSIVLYDGCTYHPFSYTFSPDLGYGYGTSMDVTVTGPDGLEADTHFVYPVASAGSDEFFLCGDVLPGTYRISATIETCNSAYDCFTFAVAPSTFNVRLPHTKTKLEAKPLRPKPGQVIAFRIASLDERPNGYYANGYATVWLEQRRGTRWIRVHKSKTTTDYRGRETLRYIYDGGRIVVRAVTANSSDLTGSESKPLVIKRG